MEKVWVQQADSIKADILRCHDHVQTAAAGLLDVYRDRIARVLEARMAPAAFRRLSGLLLVKAVTDRLKLGRGQLTDSPGFQSHKTSPLVKRNNSQ